MGVSSLLRRCGNATWSGILGVGYQSGWGDMVLAYRHLSYDETGDKPIQNLHLNDPALGLQFTW